MVVQQSSMTTSPPSATYLNASTNSGSDHSLQSPVNYLNAPLKASKTTITVDTYASVSTAANGIQYANASPIATTSTTTVVYANANTNQ
jgi:hypothetical protein